ncbi:MAG: energy coupling factor transporter S component ThiW [Clostridium sp.]|uniref:energy coupling factor transporter S component ThiW n=1 Tax=Clostridium sp. TaxID=1506 RepID=UPI00302EBC34
MNNTKKMTVAGVLIALGVCLSTFYIPLGVAKAFPIQHTINVIAGVFLGPLYAVLMAFCTSLIRGFIGTGSLLAFPGSMVGALVCGLLYKKTKKISLAFIGEVIGTGILGAIVAYPVATLLLSREAAMFAFVIPFMISSFIGAIISLIFIYALKKAKVLDKLF